MSTAPPVPVPRSLPRPARSGRSWWFALLLLGAGGALPAAALRAQRGDPAALASPKERLSYAVGMQLAQGLRQSGIEVDPELVGAGLRDVLNGRAPQLSEEQMRQALTAAVNGGAGAGAGGGNTGAPPGGPGAGSAGDTAPRAAAAGGGPNAALAERYRREGAAFLAANKSRPGIKTLPDGLQYQVLREGRGAVPTLASTVAIQYRGTLTSGKEFDSSARQGGQPVSFPVNRLIPAWQEALRAMKVGSKWKLFVPPELAYGENGTPDGTIPPNATLIFEVELVNILP